MASYAPLTPIPAAVGEKTTIQDLLEAIWSCNSVSTMRVMVRQVESMFPACLRDPCRVVLMRGNKM